MAFLRSSVEFDRMSRDGRVIVILRRIYDCLKNSQKQQRLLVSIL